MPYSRGRPSASSSPRSSDGPSGGAGRLVSDRRPSRYRGALPTPSSGRSRRKSQFVVEPATSPTAIAKNNEDNSGTGKGSRSKKTCMRRRNERRHRRRVRGHPVAVEAHVGRGLPSLLRLDLEAVEELGPAARLAAGPLIRSRPGVLGGCGSRRRRARTSGASGSPSGLDLTQPRSAPTSSGSSTRPDGQEMADFLILPGGVGVGPPAHDRGAVSRVGTRSCPCGRPARGIGPFA